LPPKITDVPRLVRRGRRASPFSAHQGSATMATVTEPRGATRRALQTKLLMGGQGPDGIAGRAFRTVNPATEEVIAEVAEGDAADIDLAVKAARKAFDSGPWRKMDARDRGKLLHKLADLIEKNFDERAELETLDNGKPISESRN